jgi:uncharacterized repeat protein (TIGR02543 family)
MKIRNVFYTNHLISRKESTMKRIKYGIITLGLLGSAICVKSQDYLMSNDTIYTDKGYFYDHGGSSSSSSGNSTDTIIFYPLTDGNVLQFIFEEFYFNSYFDNYLEVYDGYNTRAPLIGRYDDYRWDRYPDTITATNSAGALTFVFHAPLIGYEIDWRASINSLQPDVTVAPNANFDFDTISLPLNTIQFHEVCTNHPSIWHWDFGDGVFSSEKNPLHTYIEEGVYRVTLTVTNAKGSDTKHRFIKTISVPNYTMNDTILTSDLGVFYDSGGETENYGKEEKIILTFYPKSNDEVLRCIFEYFKTENHASELLVYDGSSSDARLIGRYTGAINSIDTIIATNNQGALTFKFISTDWVVTNEGWKAKIESFTPYSIEIKPEAHFTYKTSNSDPLTVEFIDNSSNHPTSWYWDFGDGNNSTEENPLYEYQEHGIYKVSLLVGNETGIDSIYRYVGTSEINKFEMNESTNLNTDYLFFYDPGGKEWEYDKYDNTNYIVTFSPQTEGNVIQVAFEKFLLDADDLYIYNGTSIDDELIGNYSRSIGDTIVASNNQGALTFSFQAQIGSVGYENLGWEAAVISIPVYSVRFVSDVNGLIQGDTLQVIPQGRSSNSVSAIPNIGYRFIEWQDTNGLFISNTNPINIGNIKNDTTLVAIFEAEVYKISYNSNGGSGIMDSQDITFGSTVNLNISQYTKIGFEFAGWANNKNIQIANIFEDNGEFTKLTTGNDTLYAVWTPKKYEIVFDANTGVGSMPNQIIEYEATQSLNTNVYIKTGYDFAGWANNMDLQVANVFEDNGEYTKLTTGNDTLYAIWQISISSIKPDLQNDVSFYPNPVNEVLNISAQFKYDIYIYNLYGYLVFKKQDNWSYEKINLQNLKQGTYFLKIEGDNYNFIEVLIKE